MDYSEKYREIASQLWAATHKGPLFTDDLELREYKGLSGGEGVVYQVAAAIGSPSTHQMPPLDDICHRLSSDWQRKILTALIEMFGYRC